MNVKRAKELVLQAKRSKLVVKAHYRKKYNGGMILPSSSLIEQDGDKQSDTSRPQSPVQGMASIESAPKTLTRMQNAIRFQSVVMDAVDIAIGDDPDAFEQDTKLKEDFDLLTFLKTFIYNRELRIIISCLIHASYEVYINI